MKYSIAEMNVLQKQVVMEFSELNTAHYVQGHTGTAPWYSLEQSLVIGCSRLQLILENQRSNLSGKFTEADIRALLDVSGGMMLSHESIESLSWHLSVHYTTDKGSDAIHDRNLLCRRISALSYVERMVLMDAVEQAWHRAPFHNVSIRDFFLTLEIELL
nr:hypothetical protein [uncultured Albidiferax sp.]